MFLPGIEDSGELKLLWQFYAISMWQKRQNLDFLKFIFWHFLLKVTLILENLVYHNVFCISGVIPFLNWKLHSL